MASTGLCGNGGLEMVAQFAFSKPQACGWFLNSVWVFLVEGGVAAAAKGFDIGS